MGQYGKGQVQPGPARVQPIGHHQGQGDMRGHGKQALHDAQQPHYGAEARGGLQGGAEITRARGVQHLFSGLGSLEHQQHGYHQIAYNASEYDKDLYAPVAYAVHDVVPGVSVLLHGEAQEDIPPALLEDTGHQSAVEHVEGRA